MKPFKKYFHRYGLQLIVGLFFTAMTSGLFNMGTEDGAHEFSMAKVAPESSSLRRTLSNRERLGKMYVGIRPKIAAVISDMESHGFAPYIDPGVHRTLAQQARLKRAGYSTVSYSYHTVTGPGGRPESLAADMPDFKYGWKPPKRYWVMLARCARAHGLNTGIFFFKKGRTKASAAHAARAKAALLVAVKTRNFDYKGEIGWDPSHNETTGVSLGQAKAGKRPR